MADHSHPLIELTRGRLLELVREPAIVFWVFGFPILLSIGLGIAFRERAPEVPVIAVVGAPALAASLDASAELDAQALEAAAAAEALRKNRVDVVLTLASETATAVRYRFDPARAMRKMNQGIHLIFVGHGPFRPIAALILSSPHPVRLCRLPVSDRHRLILL